MRIRTIKPDFWTSESISTVGAWHRLLFIGLWQIADREGRLEDRPKRIKAMLFPYDSIDVDELLDDLVAAKLITPYQAEGRDLLAIPGFARHQRPNHREPASILPDPSLSQALPVRHGHAERNGQIPGLNTNGRRLSSPEFVAQLVEAGLDHVQITVESHQESIHDLMVSSHGAFQQTIKGLENALESPLYVMTNTTLLENNSPYLADTLEFLAALGVPTIGLNALIYSGDGLTVGTGLKESQLPVLLEMARQITDAHHQRLIWYTPTQYVILILLR